MKTIKNIIPMEQVKKKNDYEERMKEWEKEKDEINKQLKKKDYILTVHQIGDKEMSSGEHEKQVDTRRFYSVCSLEEIPEYIKWMKEPFWEQPKGLSKNEIKNYPFEKKKWGKYSNVTIEPLSEELEKKYLSASEDGFFKTWRMIRDEDK